MTWVSILLMVGAFYGGWEVVSGLRAGRMEPITVGGSYLGANRTSNPVGFWLATTYNIAIAGGCFVVAFLP